MLWAAWDGDGGGATCVRLSRRDDFPPSVVRGELAGCGREDAGLVGVRSGDAGASPAGAGAAGAAATWLTNFAWRISASSGFSKSHSTPCLTQRPHCG